MNTIFEIITILPLLFAFVLLVKERHRFVTLSYFVASIPLIILARLAELIIKFRVGASWESTIDVWLLNTVSDLADVAGIFLLIIGFMKTLRVQREADDTIKKMEILLPMCAACKKVRGEDGAWNSIEHFLLSRGGASQITHGYCPECAEKAMREAAAYFAKKTK